MYRQANASTFFICVQSKPQGKVKLQKEMILKLIKLYRACRGKITKGI